MRTQARSPLRGGVPEAEAALESSAPSRRPPKMRLARLMAGRRIAEPPGRARAQAADVWWVHPAAQEYNPASSMAARPDQRSTHVGGGANLLAAVLASLWVLAGAVPALAQTPAKNPAATVSSPGQTPGQPPASAAGTTPAT